jgi:hypothetical protein
MLGAHHMRQACSVRPFVWDRGVLSFLFLFGSYSFDSYSAFAEPAFSSFFANVVER